MSSSPQSHSQWRFPRARLEGTNPAVLRFQNGRTTGANLQVVSLSGGLLSLSEAVDQGSQVRLIFLTGAGAVLGGAEMLPPIRDHLQPFRFVSLGDDDQRRLGKLVGQHATQNQPEQDWIEKFRTASAQRNEPRRWGFKAAQLIGALMAGLVAGAYALHLGLGWNLPFALWK